jgi:hypothetical protein
MPLTRGQAKALGITPQAAVDNPDKLAKEIKKKAEEKRVQDEKTAAELDQLADLFSSKISMGESPEDALAKAMAGLGIGGRRKTRKGKKSKKARKTRKH